METKKMPVQDLVVVQDVHGFRLLLHAQDGSEIRTFMPARGSSFANQSPGESLRLVEARVTPEGHLLVRSNEGVPWRSVAEGGLKLP